MPAKIDLTGQRFGRLAVIREGGRSPSGKVQWKCRCDCGVTLTVTANALRVGETRSCGCLQREVARATFTTHGMKRTRVYNIWCGILRRCMNPNEPSYPNYGGRGITVCERWRSFEHFYADMGDPPPGTSIDRIDNERGYEPGNCRWATKPVQNRNRRGNIRLTFDGRTQVLKDWADEVGIPYGTLYARYQAGLRPPELFSSGAPR